MDKVAMDPINPIKRTSVACQDIFESAAKNDLVSVKYYVEKKDVPVKAMNEDDQTAAHIAARNRNFTILQYLVSKDLKVISVKDKWDQSVLHQAVKAGSLEIVKYLVDECKANVNTPKGEIFGDTCVHIAAQEGQIDVLKYFLEDKKLNPNVRNSLGEPPMFLAAEKDHLEIVKYLCESHRADPTQVDNNQKNILFSCAVHGVLRIAQYLLDERKVSIDVNWRDVFGQTIIFVASRFEKLKFIKYFVEEKKADINIANTEGKTPIHEAASEGYLEIVKYLYEKGAAVDVKDKEKNTPRKVAKRKEVKEYLDSINATRRRRSLPAAPSRLSSSRTWVRNNIAAKSTSVDRIEGSKSVDHVASFQVERLLTLANACFKRHKRSQPREDNHESLSSPHEILRRKMDPSAIEAIYEYEVNRETM